MNNLKLLGTLVLLFTLFYLTYKVLTLTIDTYEHKVEDPLAKTLIEELRMVDPSIDAIVDNLNFYNGVNRTYTMNKRDVYLCSVDANGQQYHKNQLVLAMLHELSHALCPDVGHSQRFNQILDDLLQKAAAKGLYDPSQKSDPSYCQW